MIMATIYRAAFQSSLHDHEDKKERCDERLPVPHVFARRVAVLRLRLRLMARLQLAINVPDLDAATDFYSRLLGTEPAKREDGYVNFAVADPPLKLILFEGEAGTVNHLGIEVETADDVEAAQRRLSSEGLDLDEEWETTCCYAKQDKVWATAPDGVRWEVYTVLEDVASTPA